MMEPDVPANDLPHLTPDADMEAKSVLRHAISANREIVGLKGYCSLLPNETMLLNTIVLKEAGATFEIENIISTQDEIYRALATCLPPARLSLQEGSPGRDRCGAMAVRVAIGR